MKVIYEHVDYKIILEDRPNAAAIKLLHHTLWGTNGPLYQHLDTPEKAHELKSALSFMLERKRKVIGTCTVLERSIVINEKTYTTFYCRYFSIDKQAQGKIFGHLLLKQMKIYMEKINTGAPTIFYAYVDQDNPRSGKLLKNIGFEVMRSFKTSMFSRMYPKKDRRIHRISERDKSTIQSLLKKQYDDHSFVNFETLFLKGNYFVLKEDRELVAGIQGTIVNWKIHHLPGFSGKIMLNLLPRVPFLSRMFNPDDFRFVAFDAIYCAKGKEAALFKLMEHACAQLKLCAGMVWMDPGCDLYQRMNAIGNWGFMNKMKEDLPAYVVGGFKNMDEADKKMFSELPVYVSSFDLT
jgi:RimJ/RimL family protein N-acetyltransferase